MGNSLKKCVSLLLSLCMLMVMTPSVGATDFIGYDWLTDVVSLDVPIYFQTGENTCGSAAGVMALRYLASKGEISFDDSISDIAFRGGTDSPIEPAPLADRMNKYDHSFLVGQCFDYNEYFHMIRESLENGNPVPVLAYDFNTTYFTWPYKAHWIVVSGILKDRQGNYWFDVREPRANQRAGDLYCDQKTGRVLIPTEELYKMGYNDVHEDKSYRFVYSTKKRGFVCDHSAGFEFKTVDDLYGPYCNKCGVQFPLTLDTSAAGKYIVGKKDTSDESSNRAAINPYRESCTNMSPYNGLSRNILYAPGTELNIVGSVTNYRGNTWYKIKENNFYIYEGWVTKAETSIDKPTNLKAEHLTDTTAKISWSAVSGATGYEAQFSRENGGWNSDTEYSSGTSYNVTGLNWSTYSYYRFRVRAKSAAGESDWTEVILNKPSSTAVPSAPTGLTGTRSGSNVNLTWNAVSGATSYAIQYCNASSNGWQTPKESPASTNSATITSFGWGYDYIDFRVWAQNQAGTSNGYSEVRVYKNASSVNLPYPDTLSAVWEAGNKATLSWSSVPGATYYQVEYKTKAMDENGEDWKVDGTNITGTSFTSTGLKNHDYFLFQVKAGNASGTSPNYKWIKVYKTITATFDANGGTTSETSRKYTYDSTTGTPATFGTLPTPSRTGYSFDGWYTKQTGGTKITSSTAVTATQGITLYAHWTAATYTVTYNANGGTDAPAAQTKTHGTALTLSSVKPSRKSDSAGSYTVTLNANGGSVSQNTVTAAKTTNYSFKNWNTASNGSGTSYNAGASYTANAGVTLYAQWTSSTSVSQVTLPTPTRTGYTFKGWGTTANATTGTTGSYTPQSDVTLYAVWQASTYTVTYNANGGTGAPAAQTKTHGAALTLSSTNPSRTSSAASSYVVTLNANGGTCSAASIEATRLTDYSFKNWNTKADGTGTAYSSGASYTTDASATLYAQWSSTTKTKSVTLPTPVRSGYTFLGWEESGNSSARFTESYTPGGNVTLNAVWQDNTFSVDINGWLDGAMAGNIAGYGTVDVWINGEKVADDVTDYSAKWPAGTSYEVNDIKAAQGHAYVGVADGTLSGTVGEGYTGIRLSFSTQYTVSFDANGGDVSTANKTVLLGGKYGTLPVPSREGYRFTGWYSENALITASTVVSKDAATALTAHWEAISAEEVHLNKTTAELVVGDKVILEATITPADALNKTVTWSSSDNSVAAVDQTSGEVTAVGAGTATITATAADGSRVSASCRIVVKKSLNSYTVSFDANGGSAAPDPLTKTEGTAIVLPAAIPERSGYTFLGWSESDAATVADYAAGGSLNKDADIVLYAIWKKNDLPADAAELVIESAVARAGDTVKVTYVLKNSCELKSIALFNLTYNSDALELVSGEWKVTDTVLQNWNSTTTNGAVAFDENSKVDGEIFAATFKVKDGTGDGDYRISCDITAKTRTEMGTEEVVEIVTVDGGVTVISYISGDVDDDGNVTSDDAIYVLYYTLLPDMYPVNQPVDFDGDGQITSDDAIYLLYYTLLPDLYPLS